MASNWLMIFENVAANATFTATNDSGYPEANLATTRTDKIYQRTATVTALTVDIDFGAGSDIIGATEYGVVWGGTNLGDGATWSIITDDNSGFSSSATVRTSAAMFDVTATNPTAWQQPWGRHGIHIESTTAAERFMRLSFTESGGTVLDGAFVFAGRTWSPDYGPQSDWKRTTKHLAGHRVIRGIELEFKSLTPDEAAEIMNILNYIGRERRVFIVPKTNHDETWLTEAMLCTMAEDPVWTEWDGGPAKTVSIRVEFEEVDY